MTLPCQRTSFFVPFLCWPSAHVPPFETVKKDALVSASRVTGNCAALNYCKVSLRSLVSQKSVDILRKHPPFHGHRST